MRERGSVAALVQGFRFVDVTRDIPRRAEGETLHPRQRCRVVLQDTQRIIHALHEAAQRGDARIAHFNTLPDEVERKDGIRARAARGAGHDGAHRNDKEPAHQWKSAGVEDVTNILGRRLSGASVPYSSICRGEVFSSVQRIAKPLFLSFSCNMRKIAFVIGKSMTGCSLVTVRSVMRCPVLNDGLAGSVLSGI